MALLSSASAVLHHHHRLQLGSCGPSTTTLSPTSTAGPHLSCPGYSLLPLAATHESSTGAGSSLLQLRLVRTSPSLPFADDFSSRRSRWGSNSRSSRKHMADKLVCQQQGQGEPAVEKKEYFLPLTLEESIDQARTASRQAIRDGIKRLQLEVPLPLIGATDLDDWPGGIQQQFRAAGPVVTSLLSGLVDSDNYKQESAFRSYIIDEGDAVGVWENDQAALVLFPTADSLDSVEALAQQDRPLLLVNAQWQSGQVISDFGFGARKKAREEFVQTFEVVYLLKQLRILGEDVRLLKRYPGDWQVFVIAADGGSACVAVESERPSYKALEALLKSRKGSKAGQGWLSRLFSELEFNQKSLKE